MPIAVTMGDGAGIGPEIVVAALNETDHETVVIGDRKRLEQAARDPRRRTARATSSTSTCCPKTSPGARCRPQAGEAAYRYIERAAQLALAKEVDAICTAPINKAALHAAGHKFPGHTELLAHLTGTDEVSMMLSTPKVKVIHVTTHIGLLDAIERIEPGLVERTIRRGHEALGQPPDRRLRDQPPRRRGRAVRPRRGGDEDRAGDRSGPQRTASTPTARSPPTPRSSSPAAATTT